MPNLPSATTDDPQPQAPPAVQGTCYALFAYEVALSVDLDRAEKLITADKQRGSIRRKRRAPYYFDYQPAPLRVTLAGEPIGVGTFTTEPTVEAVLYDFGAVSVQYSIRLDHALTELLSLSEELWDHRHLHALAHQTVEALLASIAPAVTKPAMSDRVEDYVIYQIDALTPALDVAKVTGTHGPLLAQILRAERDPLAAGEIADALACQISFGPDDLALIDWNATLLFDRDADDVRAVLEFANAELLEYRFLDDRLDEVLNEAYETARRAERFRAFPGSKAAELQRIAELQTDGALFYEGVNNALKLLGDQYLARVHRLVSQRFHLDDWDRSIQRKLQTIESIYEKTSDRHANQRVETLEWIIIVLIAAEIVLSLVHSTPQG